MSKYENDLVYGRDKTERIVGLEVKDDLLYIYQEMEDGSIEESTRPAAYWVITNTQISPKQDRLEGHQFYKYFAEFSTQKEYKEVTSKLYQKRSDFYRIADPVEAMMVLEGMTYFKGMKPNEVSILSWDIESDGLKKTNDSEIYIISNTYRSATGEEVRHSFYLDDYDSQADMLLDWCDFVNELNPSIMVGHNIYGYDWEYITHVADLNNVSLNIGRDGSAIRFNNRTSMFRKDGSQSLEYTKVYVFGRTIIDSMFLSYKYDIGRAFPSYGLKPIIRHLGLEKKDRTFVDASMIKKYFYEREKYPGMWELAKAYASDDSDDSLKLYDLMIPAFFYMTINISKPFQEINTSATGSQINNMMVRAYLQDGHSIAKADEAQYFEGGISLGVPGIYKHAKKWDLASAYPHTIIQYKLFNKKKDPKGYFLVLVEFFTKERIKNKKLSKETGEAYYEDLQQAMKILINSFFGFCGAAGLNYNSPDIAAEITRRCRGYIMDAVMWATGKSVEYWKNINVVEDNLENV